MDENERNWMLDDDLFCIYIDDAEEDIEQIRQLCAMQRLEDMY